jgi:hypothetical protein
LNASVAAASFAAGDWAETAVAEPIQTANDRLYDALNEALELMEANDFTDTAEVGELAARVRALIIDMHKAPLADEVAAPITDQSAAAVARTERQQPQPKEPPTINEVRSRLYSIYALLELLHAAGGKNCDLDAFLPAVIAETDRAIADLRQIEMSEKSADDDAARFLALQRKFRAMKPVELARVAENHDLAAEPHGEESGYVIRHGVTAPWYDKRVGLARALAIEEFMDPVIVTAQSLEEAAKGGAA